MERQPTRVTLSHTQQHIISSFANSVSGQWLGYVVGRHSFSKTIARPNMSWNNIWSSQLWAQASRMCIRVDIVQRKPTIGVGESFNNMNTYSYNSLYCSFGIVHKHSAWSGALYNYTFRVVSQTLPAICRELKWQRDWQRAKVCRRSQEVIHTDGSFHSLIFSQQNRHYNIVTAYTSDQEEAHDSPQSYNTVTWWTINKLRLQ